MFQTDEPWPYFDNPHMFRVQLAEMKSVAADLPNRLTIVAGCLTAAAGPPSLGALPFVLDSLQRLERETPGQRILRQVTRLEGREHSGDLTLDDRINLGACYIRLGQYRRAIRVLEPAVSRRHFMVLANLATAYELEGFPKRAISYRQQALASWPSMRAGWSYQQLSWFRKAEKYHLMLTQMRWQEAQRSGQGQSPEGLDALFPRVRFVGPSGEYEPGIIAPESWGNSLRTLYSWSNSCCGGCPWTIAFTGCSPRCSTPGGKLWRRRMSSRTWWRSGNIPCRPNCAGTT